MSTNPIAEQLAEALRAMRRDLQIAVEHSSAGNPSALLESLPATNEALAAYDARYGSCPHCADSEETCGRRECADRARRAREHWVSKGEGGMWILGTGNAELATIRDRELAMKIKDLLNG